MKKLKISVIVPAYNAEQTITPCLKALKEQTLKPTEIIVVDDHSEDETATLARKWAKVIPSTCQKGPAGSRNAGAKVAQGEILAFTDSDCVPPKDWLTKIVQALANPQIGAVGGGFSSGTDKSFWQKFCFEELHFRRQKLQGPVTTLLSCNFACRKTAFLKAGGFPEQYRFGEDMLLSYNLSRYYQVLWLKNIGIRHHFRNSLRTYLRHQYFTGQGSTKFFLENPRFFIDGNFQGRKLHLGIMFSFLILFSLMAIVFSKTFLTLLLLSLLAHLFIYSGFLFHLKRKKFSGLDIWQAYFISLLRDWLCLPSSVTGFLIFLQDRLSKA